MAKRFTDTEKWKKPWFRALPGVARLAWFYLLDNCDHRGVWDADFGLMAFQLGEPISPADFEKWFSGKVYKIDSDKFFVPSFIEFQYSKGSKKVNLCPDNRVHLSVIEFLESLKHGPLMGLVRPLLGCKDKDKDKDMDKSMDKETDKDKDKEQDKARKEISRFLTGLKSIDGSGVA